MSPSGKHWTKKQVVKYYASNGFGKGVHKLYASKRKKKMISMTKAAFLKEHRHLLQVLKGGKRGAMNKEAEEQREEAKKYGFKI